MKCFRYFVKKNNFADQSGFEIVTLLSLDVARHFLFVCLIRYFTKMYEFRQENTAPGGGG